MMGDYMNNGLCDIDFQTFDLQDHKHFDREYDTDPGTHFYQNIDLNGEYYFEDKLNFITELS